MRQVEGESMRLEHQKIIEDLKKIMNTPAIFDPQEFGPMQTQRFPLVLFWDIHFWWRTLKLF